MRTTTPRTTRAALAGYLPPFGPPSSPEALAAARELGVDLAPHRSRPGDEAQVARADVILVFDQDNHDEVRGWYPAAASRVHYLASSAGRLWIADPGESHAGQLRRAYRRIAVALDAAPRDLVTAQQGARACS